MMGEYSHRQRTFGFHFNVTLVYIKQSELLSGNIRGEREK